MTWFSGGFGNVMVGLAVSHHGWAWSVASRLDLMIPRVFSRPRASMMVSFSRELTC